MNWISICALSLGIINTAILLMNPLSTRHEHIVVDPDPRKYSICRPVLSCTVREIPLGVMTHEGIRIEMHDTRAINGNKTISFTYGLPQRPCFPKERPIESCEFGYPQPISLIQEFK